MELENLNNAADTRLYQSQIEQELTTLSVQLVSFKSEFSALSAAKKDIDTVRRIQTISIQIYMLLERIRLLQGKLNEMGIAQKSQLDQLSEQYMHVRSELGYLAYAGSTPEVRNFQANLSVQSNDLERQMVETINASLVSPSLAHPPENDLQILSERLRIIQGDIRTVSSLAATGATQKILQHLRTKDQELNRLIWKIQSDAKQAERQKQLNTRLTDLKEKKDRIVSERKLTIPERISFFFREQHIRRPGVLTFSGVFVFFCSLCLTLAAISSPSSATSDTALTTPQDASALQTEAFGTAVAVINQTMTAMAYKTLPTVTPTLIATATPAPIEGVIIQDVANMRSFPSLESPIVTALQLNSKVIAIANAEDGNWMLVYTQNHEKGWVYKQLIQFPGNTEMLPISTEVVPTLAPTVAPPATLIPAVYLNSIYDSLQNKTALQFQEYTQSITGKPVRENVTIGNVDEKGRVILHGPWSAVLFNVTEFCVVVTGMPAEKSIKLSPSDHLYLKATINGIVGDYNYFYNCENTLLLNYAE